MVARPGAASSPHSKTGGRPPFALSAEASALVGPKIDVAETKDAIDLTAELPGAEEHDIELTSVADHSRPGEDRTEKTEREEKDTSKNWHVIEPLRRLQ
jgi:HSP20 family protein